MKTSLKTIKIVTISIFITSGFVLAQNTGTTTTTRGSTIESPVSDSGETAVLGDSSRSVVATNPTEPTKRPGESADAYQNRLRQWDAWVRQNATPDAPNRVRTTGVSDLPERPAKRPGESDTSYNNRLRQWDTQIRSMMEGSNLGTTAVTPEFPERPNQRAGESAAAYQNRLREWEASVRRLTYEQTEKQKDEELNRLRQQIAELNNQIVGTTRTSSYTNPDSENMLIVPSGEMSAEGLMKINEDLNIMSRILVNELQKIDTSSIYTPPWENTSGTLTSVRLRTGRNLNTFSSMYLQDYGVLFKIQVNFSLSVPSGIQSEQEETQKEDTDDIWQQTRRQLYDTQPPTRGNSINRVPVGLIYGGKKVEELKTTLIQALKYASNISLLRPDESVILRITGTDDESIRVFRVVKDGDKSIIEFEKNGIRQATKFSGDIKDYLKSISTPTVLVIRAKNSDIYEFAKGELGFDKFRGRVQVFSYPLISGNIN